MTGLRTSGLLLIKGVWYVWTNFNIMMDEDSKSLDIVPLELELRKGKMMMQDLRASGARFLLNGACLVIVVAGLREASSLFLPFAIALFLSILSMPVLSKIRSKTPIPDFLAVLITLGLIGALFSGLILLGVRAISDLQMYLPEYRESISNLYSVWIDGLSARFAFPIQEYLTLEFFDPGVAVDFFGKTAASVLGFLTNIFLVLLIMGFILAEATIFPPKFKVISEMRSGMSLAGVHPTKPVKNHPTVRLLETKRSDLLVKKSVGNMNRLLFPMNIILLGMQNLRVKN